MNHRTPIALAALAAAALAAPSLATAHHAAVTCSPTDPGQFVVVADYLHLSPVTTFGPTTATTVWSDGFTVVNPLPAGCVPAPAPVPPAIDVTPPVVVVTPDAPEALPPKRPTPPPLRAHRSERVIRAYACKGPGTRSHRLVRIVVQWTRDGKVVKTRSRVVRRAGAVCRVPAVTG